MNKVYLFVRIVKIYGPENGYKNIERGNDMISKLITEIKKKNAPVVVGLDPQLSFLPKFLLDKAIAGKGESLEAVSEAIYEYNKGLIDATYELIPAVKPQIAMYEDISHMNDDFARVLILLGTNLAASAEFQRKHFPDFYQKAIGRVKSGEEG